MFFLRFAMPPLDSATARSFLGAFLVACLMTNSAWADQGEAVQLVPRADQNLMRVRIELDVKGNVNVPDNPLVSRQSELTLPIKSDATFDYEERYLRPPQVDPRSEVPTVERYYHKASSSSQLNRNESTLQLRDSVRHVHVRRDSLPETIYAVDDYFSGDELGLLRIPVSSAAVDQLLPVEAVKVGDKYRPPHEAIVALLNLSAVIGSDMELEVVSIDPRHVKMTLRGKVDGSVEGVPTVIRSIGKMVFDRQLGTTIWLAIALHETREIGKAEPGFDVAATIKMLRRPLSETIALAATPPKLDSGRPIPEERIFVDLQSKQVGVGVLLDRRWKMMTDVPGSTVLRMIDTDRSIAQCNLRPLAKLEPGKQLTLEAFQQDSRRTLGEQFSEFVEAEQRVSATGLRVLRVVAQGAVEGVPIQWTILHFSDDSGRRVLATFTMSADSVETFAGADVQFADSLRLLPTASGSLETAGTHSASSPAATVAAARNSGAGSEERVQSASDLR